MTITPAQCRAARALLEWTQDDLAAHSKVSKRTILHFEKTSGRRPIPATLTVLRQTFEEAGVEFCAEDGVRLKAAH